MWSSQGDVPCIFLSLFGSLNLAAANSVVNSGFLCIEYCCLALWPSDLLRFEGEACVLFEIWKSLMEGIAVSEGCMETCMVGDGRALFDDCLWRCVGGQRCGLKSEHL